MDSYYLINGEVKATSEHPFFIFDGSDYKFVSTLNLQVGWFLYTIDSPITRNARGFSRGSIFSRDGKLIASCTQEGLIRLWKN